MELLDGDERTLQRLEKELRKAGARRRGGCSPKLYRALDLAGAIETRRRRRGRRRARRSGSRSRASTGRCSPTTRARAGVTTRRTCTSFGSRRGASARSSARRAGSSTTMGERRCGRSRLARRASRPGARPRRHAGATEGGGRRLGRDAAAETGLLEALEASGQPPTGMSPRRSTATATSHCSTGSRRRPRRRSRATRRPSQRFSRGRRSGCGGRSRRLGTTRRRRVACRRIEVKRARYAADLAAHELGGQVSGSSRSRSSCRTFSATIRTRSSPRPASGTGRPRLDPAARSPRDGSSSSSGTAWPPRGRLARTWKRLDDAARRAVR